MEFGGKQAQALALKAQGLSVRAIAAQMGISKTAAGRYIAEPGECPKSMRITNGEAYARRVAPAFE